MATGGKVTAFTVEGDEPSFAVVPGNRRRVSVNLKGPADYDTGGNAILASSFGLNKIDAVQISHNTTGTHYYVWDSANQLLLAFVAATGAQVANDVDLSAHIIPATMWGI